MNDLKLRGLAELLGEHPFFSLMPPDLVAQLAGCAINVHVDTDQYLFLSHAPAEHIYLIRRGRVALEVSHSTGPAVVVETADAGSVVGLSWLAPPYRNYLDARAVESTSAVSLDAGCVRAACEQDPLLGFRVMQRVAESQAEVIESARLRLLDMYGARR